MPRIALVAIALSCSIAFGASSGKTAGADAISTTGAAAGIQPLPSTTAVAAAEDATPFYPDWARAVAPPYPNAAFGFLVNTYQYQMQSKDDLATVSAWYKSRISAPWKVDATSGSTSATVNGVQFAIAKLSGPTGDAAGPKTMINVTQTRR